MLIEEFHNNEEDSNCGGNIENNSNFFDNESDNDEKPCLENVAMLFDIKNFIYYMTKT